MTAVDLAAVARARAALAAIARDHPDLTAPTAMVRLRYYLDTELNAHGVCANWYDTTMADDTVTFTARLPRSLLDALDAEAERLGSLAGGITVSRNDALRVTLKRALATPALAPAAPAPAPAEVSARRAVVRSAPAPAPEAEAVRKRYRDALDAKRLKGNRTADAIGCSEPLLRKWSTGAVQTLRPEWLAKLVAVLDREGL